MLTPSSRASSISASAAGISSRVRRYHMETSVAPSLRAHRAASIAVLPPPMTATRLPTFTGLPAFTSRRKSIPESTSGWSSPGMRSARLLHAPTARMTASYCLRSCSRVTSFPRATPVRSFAPRLSTSVTALSRTAAGSR
jgi:hypothetical protein